MEINGNTYIQIKKIRIWRKHNSKIFGDKYKYTVNGSKHLMYMEMNRNTYVQIKRNICADK